MKRRLMMNILSCKIVAHTVNKADKGLFVTKHAQIQAFTVKTHVKFKSIHVKSL